MATDGINPRVAESLLRFVLEEHSEGESSRELFERVNAVITTYTSTIFSHTFDSARYWVPFVGSKWESAVETIKNVLLERVEAGNLLTRSAGVSAKNVSDVAHRFLTNICSIYAHEVNKEAPVFHSSLRMNQLDSDETHLSDDPTLIGTVTTLLKSDASKSCESASILSRENGISTPKKHD